MNVLTLYQLYTAGPSLTTARTEMELTRVTKRMLELGRTF
jgi:hypothetical protein